LGDPGVHVTAPAYVIREGHARKQGRYLQACEVGPIWGGPQLAARFFSLGAAIGRLDSTCARIVRIVRKPRDVVSVEHHMASVAMTRLAALEEAERVARDPSVPLTGIADAIVAIRGSK